MTEPAGEVSRNTRNLMRVLEFHGIDLVLDIGANVGQYGRRLRRGGYRGRIVSFEPLSAAHAALTEAAAGDGAWEVAPRVAIGDSDRPVTVNISATSDLSSVLDFTREMADLLDSSAYVGSEVASQARLEALFGRFVRPGERVLLKTDTQGYDRQVIEGARGILKRVPLIQVELSVVAIYRGGLPWLDMVRWLDTLGYSPIFFIPGYFNRRTARLLEMDGVFLRRDADPPGG
jgi:FkbM family methyltransferase